jgi:hypothetical protein
MRDLNSSERKRLNYVLQHGEIVATAGMNEDGKFIRIYRTSESRGASTKYMSKEFFSAVIFKGHLPVDCMGFTRDARRHTIEDHWKKQGFNYTITDEAAFKRFTS